jgi:hypothetical protein
MTTENKLKTVVILTENQRQHLSDSKNLSDTHRGIRPYREPARHCVFTVYPVESGPAGVSVTCFCTVINGLYRLPWKTIVTIPHALAGVAQMRACGNSSCCWFGTRMLVSTQ